MAHGPDYTLTYIEQTIQSLSIRGLTITPVDVLTGIWKLNAANINGRDAETILRHFLIRLSPLSGHSTRRLTVRTFPGWPAIADYLKIRTNMELFTEFGSDSIRVAAVVTASA